MLTSDQCASKPQLQEFSGDGKKETVKKAGKFPSPHSQPSAITKGIKQHENGNASTFSIPDTVSTDSFIV